MLSKIITSGFFEMITNREPVKKCALLTVSYILCIFELGLPSLIYKSMNTRVVQVCIVLIKSTTS